MTVMDVLKWNDQYKCTKKKTIPTIPIKICRFQPKI